MTDRAVKVVVSLAWLIGASWTVYSLGWLPGALISLAFGALFVWRYRDLTRNRAP